MFLKYNQSLWVNKDNNLKKKHKANGANSF